jgi:Flp pilus assembly protein TadG
MVWPMKHRGRRDEGAAAVEFALVAFILVLLVFGIIQFGYLFFQWLETTHAAREGVRWAALGNPVADVEAKAKAAAPGLNWTGNGTVQVVYPGATTPGNPVTVRITYNTPLFAPLMQNLFGVGNATTFTLRSAATQRIE